MDISWKNLVSQRLLCCYMEELFSQSLGARIVGEWDGDGEFFSGHV